MTDTDILHNYVERTWLTLKRKGRQPSPASLTSEVLHSLTQAREFATARRTGRVRGLCDLFIAEIDKIDQAELDLADIDPYDLAAWEGNTPDGD